jgi:phosphatidylglycerol:prolipoprotein diacylglycerol transferase
LITIGIDPVVFTIGSLSVRWYGIIAAIAILTLISLVLRWSKRAGFNEDTIFWVIIWGIPGGIIGSRLLHVLDGLDYYLAHPGKIVGMEGLTIFGAILGAALSIAIYSKVKNLPLGRLLDMIMPGAILAQAIGRIGCTINGCCYGIATSLPWGLVYAHEESIYLRLGEPRGVPVHPTQVYELLGDLIIFGILLRLRGRLKPDGSLTLVYFILYPLLKFSVHFLRAGTPFFFGLQEAQFVSLVVLAAAIVLLVRSRVHWSTEEAIAELPDAGNHLE